MDVPGCLTIAESGKKATAKKLCFQVDFQTRANKLYQDAVKAVHDGEIGKIVSVEANYQCGATWDAMDQLLRKDPKNPEVRLRAWGVDRLLSGDIITEQNIHALDVACWMLDAEPVRAYGTGGRKREFFGNCWDHFAVIFYYPNDLVVSFNSHQSGFGYDDIMCRVYGLKGTADTHYFGNVRSRPREFHLDGSVGNLFTRRSGDQYRDLPRQRHQGRMQQPDRPGQRAEQPDHYPGPDGGLQERRGHVGGNDAPEREVYARPQGVEGVTYRSSH